jgi:TRAP transporter TAXI family solute receptor
VRPILQRVALAVCVMLFAACSRGPDVPGLERDVQARVDTLFGRQVLQLESLRRQGSAPYAAAGDGARQIVVYYNAVFRVAEAYDPSDWQGLSPTMIANALGAADEGVTGLKSGPNAPGTELRAYGSIVYRRDGKEWQPAVDLVPRVATTAASAIAAPKSHANELVQRLAELVQNAPARRGQEDEIIAEELERALDNIRLRTSLAGNGSLVAAGPQGGEYWRFMSSVVTRVGGPALIGIAASAGSIENALMINRGDAVIGLVQSDVAAAAVTGDGMFSGTGPLDHLRAVASLFPEPVHIVVRADSGIEQAGELAGRRVALGAVASGTRQTALRLLETVGVDVKSISSVDAPTPQAALDMLTKGEIDAVIEVVSAPWRQLEIAMDGTPLALVALDAETIARVDARTHGLMPLAIPARTYPGQRSEVATLAATALLVARDDVPDAVVEDTLDLLYASAASGGAGVHATRLSKARALTGVTIPMHPAAARYFATASATAAPVADAPRPAATTQ